MVPKTKALIRLMALPLVTPARNLTLPAIRLHVPDSPQWQLRVIRDADIFQGNAVASLL